MGFWDKLFNRTPPVKYDTATLAFMDDLILFLTRGIDDDQFGPMLNPANGIRATKKILDAANPERKDAAADSAYSYSWFSAFLMLFIDDFVKSQDVWKNNNNVVCDVAMDTLKDWCEQHGEKREEAETRIDLLLKGYRLSELPLRSSKLRDMTEGRCFICKQHLGRFIQNEAVVSWLTVLDPQLSGAIRGFFEERSEGAYSNE